MWESVEFEENAREKKQITLLRGIKAHLKRKMGTVIWLHGDQQVFSTSEASLTIRNWSNLTLRFLDT